MPRLLRALTTISAVLVTAVALAGDPVIELQVGRTKHRGKLLEKTSRQCWLLGTDGAISEIDLADVTSFRKVGSDFRPVSSAVLGDQLKQKYGREYEVSRTREFVVVAPRGRAKTYSKMLDQAYRNFRLYFRVRRFDVPEPEVPLVTIVFRSQREFAEYCRENDVMNLGYLGIYMGMSNRVALYETNPRAAVDPQPLPFDPAETIRLPQRNVFANRRGGVEDTLIHEATHQLAYNCGLHTRLGWNPKWVVEGLATVFEAPGIRRGSAGRSEADRLNPGRLVAFRDYVKQRRRSGSLENIVASDARFNSAIGDAYAEAWALTYFLLETRPRKYAAYLKTISERPMLKRYSAEERVADFKSAFGKSLPLLEADFLRFIAKLD